MEKGGAIQLKGSEALGRGKLGARCCAVSRFAFNFSGVHATAVTNIKDH